MNTKSSNIFLLIAIFCASFLSFSQVDEGLILLEDSDDNRIRFENHFFEALKYKAVGNYSRAITELEKCQQLYANDDSIEFELSKNHFSLKNYIEAALYIEKALISNPNNFWYLSQAKAIYLKQYDYEKAIAIQNKIIQQQPGTKEDLVLIYILSNQKKKAQKVLNELSADGISSLKLRNYTKALENSNKGRTSQKQTSSVGISLVELKDTFDKKKQFDVLKEILKQEFENTNFKELQKYSELGLEMFPAQPLVYLMQGRTFFNQKKYNDAVDVLNEGLDFIIEDKLLEATFYDDLALSYKELNKMQKAKEAVEKATELRKN